ncbi:hypothetical protein C7C46_28270 [Streptomyces tateyamensis]|uniref:DUF6817 domain-containing protein n=1 Tax=Streptomyces tateyamensis TaxID=565073 RepID=A0A2V4NJF4_9ACTN|nr:hypothetical protein [Streptomyces tateyamensis]PYC69148.1 hypothetical protein C7C46_28270 [Streptomyces tateyamensis]
MSAIPDEPASDDRPALDFLRSHGAAELAHPGGTLLEHLVRVRERLADWGAPREVCLAGLCHAAYGTDGFPAALLPTTERGTLAELIGDRAEALVYLYASCDRALSYPRLGESGRPLFLDRFTGSEHRVEAEELRAFLAITAANELDVFAHNAELAARYGAALHRLLAPLHDLLPPAARRELDTLGSER